MDQLRVLVADEHPIVIETLRTFLRGDAEIEIVGAANNRADSLIELQHLQPACIIVDLTQSIMNNMEMLKLYLKELPNLEIVAYTDDTGIIIVNKTVQAHLRAYVSKSAPVMDLVNTLREIHHKR